MIALVVATPSSAAVAKVSRASAPAVSANVTKFQFVSSPGDYIGGGKSGTFTRPSATFTRAGTFGIVTVQVVQGAEYWELSFAPRRGAQLFPGRYPAAQKPIYGAPDRPTISIVHNGVECEDPFASFVINFVKFDQDGRLQSLDASFVQRCNAASAAPLSGRVQYDAPPAAPVLLDLTTPTVVEGEPATFGARVALTGPTPTGTVTFTDGAKTIGSAPLDAAGIATLTTTALTIGSHAIRARYSGDSHHPAATSTAATQTVLSHKVSYWFMSGAGDWVGGGAQASYVPSRSTVSFSGGRAGLSVSAQSATDAWNIRIAPPTGKTLKVGTYTNATRYGDASHPLLEIDGDSRGCNEDVGAFTISAIGTDPSGHLNRLSAVVVQHCEELDAPPLVGVVHLNT